MKYFLAIGLLLALSFSCKPRIISGTELENKLIESMTENLHKTLKPGTPFTVKDVTYYAEKTKKLYYCEFHVSMSLGNKDTTGLMAATISNDFSSVVRTQ